jgi:hypothetical protein
MADTKYTPKQCDDAHASITKDHNEAIKLSGKSVRNSGSESKEELEKLNRERDADFEKLKQTLAHQQETLDKAKAGGCKFDTHANEPASPTHGKKPSTAAGRAS